MNIMVPDPQGFYIIDRFGDMLWLQPPFPVSCFEDVGVLKANAIVYVDQIGFTEEKDMMYVIDGRCYPYYHFGIETSF